MYDDLTKFQATACREYRKFIAEENPFLEIDETILHEVDEQMIDFTVRLIERLDKIPKGQFPRSDEEIKKIVEPDDIFNTEVQALLQNGLKDGRVRVKS